MKVILPQSKETTPFEEVARFIRSNLTPEESVKLLSVSNPKEGSKLAFSKMIITLVDSPRTSLLTLMRGRLDHILTHHPSALRAFETKEVDKVLKVGYSKEKLSDVCLEIAEFSVKSGEDDIKRLFSGYLRKGVPKDSKIYSRDWQQIIEQTFEALSKIGQILVAFDMW